MAGSSTRRFAAALMILHLVTASACSDDDGAPNADVTAGSGTVEASAAIDIEMRDYAFAVSGAMQAGGTLRMANTGKELHMVDFNKLRGDTTLAQYSKALQGADPERKANPTSGLADDVGPPGGWMGPGQKVEVTVPDFGAGRYALVCYVPTPGDDGEPHFARGMVNELVVSSDTAAEPRVDATYTIAPDRAVAGPTSVAAGRRTLKIEAVDGAEEHQFAIVRPDAGKRLVDIIDAFDAFGAFSRVPVPEDAIARVPGAVLYGMYDFRGSNTVYVTVDFEPGVYEIGGEDTDTGTPDYKETLRITVT